MTHTINFSQTRPSTNIPFYGEVLPPEFVAYFKANYVATGKFLAKEMDTSQDGLTIIIGHTWKSLADYNTYLADPWIQTNFLQPSEAYRVANGITQTTL